MNTKIVALFAITAAFISLESPAQAQSSEASSANTENISITGDSLTGINNRNAQQDFASFFEQKDPISVPSSNQQINRTSQQLQLQQSISAPDSNVFFVPSQSFNGNDGAQVQLDLGQE
ncbi:MAG: hypothetical protein KME32_27520 [Mojavia pulchra JT2-VF2]|jgi:hypothetical protein|uniref:Uncharacterized protein n=1 Tax=Mojavia pulchra JT2-VF2 TaxID=287848 RepID=A0A951Q539_9NOST|nr:hypothetical protein [Mojavia pulchra JT2-VF2]